MPNFIKFECDLDNFVANLKEFLDRNNQEIEKLLLNKEKNYNNFVKPLEMLEERLSLFFTPMSHLNSVKNSKKTQDVYADSLPLITAYETKLSQNTEIYTAYKEILKNEEKQLNDEQKRVLELNIQHFELNGANLDEDTKKRLEEIQIRKSDLSNQFSQNILDATDNYSYITDNYDDVKSLPKSEIESAKIVIDGKTKYKFTLQMPSYMAYMTYGDNREIREELYRAYTSRAPQNGKIIDEILSLRDEMSHLLGFENFAEYSLASKMAKKTSTVIGFLEELLTNSQNMAKKELEELQKFSPFKLESYDVAYFSEKLKKERYEIDKEKYRAYFQQQSVVDGMFKFLSKMFNLGFRKNREKLWDEKASSYDVLKGGKTVGRLYFDLEAREGKKGGAWMHNFQTRCKDENSKVQLASAFVICNFPPSTPTQPSLLWHDDVVTLFHEMGHALHHILSEVDESGVSGVNGVEWDAVEYPSQFLENFAYEAKVLKMFASHYETKEILPDEMIEKLIETKNFMSASAMLRQLEFSLFDFRLHLKKYEGDEVQKLLDEIREETTLIKPPKYNKFQNSFAHIFAGGYAAGYYSYKWAEVLSADTFCTVVDEGIFNSPTAQKYLDIVLGSGGSKSMQKLFVDVMQREVDTTKLLILNGIK